MSFQFIHCGDLHLGCFPNHIEERFNDFFNAFRKVIDYAIEKDVKLVLVSGDLFHLKNINSKTLQNTIDILVMAKENAIEVVAIEGNHDRAFYIDEESWLTFLNRQGYLKLLVNEIVNGKVEFSTYDGLKGNVIETENYRLIGLGYMGGSTEKYVIDMKKTLEKSKKFTIIMMHAAVNRLGQQDMGDIKKEIIDNSIKNKVDYVALGHIHNRYDYDDYIFNPGSLENIRLKDGLNAKDKGFYHVKVTDNKKEVIYINSEPRVIHFESINVEEMKTPSEVENYISNAEFNFKKNEMLDLRLYGKANFNPYLINSNLINQIIEKYELLYGEFTNHINVETGNQKYDDGIDINDIIHNFISDDIASNYPENKNIEEVTNKMMMIADAINDNDFEELTDKIIKMDVKI